MQKNTTRILQNAKRKEKIKIQKGKTMEKELKKRILKKYIFISFLLIAISVSILLMVRYNVEGEKNLPLELSKIIIKSSINAQSNTSENLWDINIEQNNDIYIYFKKNEQVDSKIETIKINNIKIEKAKEIGNLQVLLPTSNDIKTNFKNSTENYLDKEIEYAANTSDNMEKQEFCQDGGMIAFRISNKDLANYVSNEDTEIQYNGTLLDKVNISQEDIKLKATMDITLIVSEKEKYKGTITLDLPVGEFQEKSVIDKEITDFSKIIFKRSE